MENNKIKLGYWAIRGRGQIARLLLEYTHADWEDVQYTAPEKYLNQDKPKLGLDFPNLPYLLDGDFKMTESEAIERYIIERSDKRQELLGKDCQQGARIENVIGVFRDAFDGLMPLLYDKNYQQKKPQVWKKIQPKFQLLQKYIGDKEFVLGHLTYVDFIIAQRSTFVQKYFPEQFKAYPFLQRIRQNVNKIPQVVQYYTKQTAMKGPYMPPHIVSIPF